MAVRLAPDQTLIERVFQRGIVRDLDRNLIPSGGVYHAQDFLFDRPGAMYKRGGCAFHSSELTDEALIIGVAAPEFPGDPRVLAFASNGADTTVYDVTDDTAATGVDANSALLLENPPLYVDRLIVCDGYGVAPVQKVYLSGAVVTVDDLGGSPPIARYSCVHLDRLVLANSLVNPNRIWFSPIPDIEDTWDTTVAYIDVASPVTGLASVQGMLLVFARGRCWRILGVNPPGSVDSSGSPNEDMELQPIGATGCIDARSIVQMQGLVYFANESGVFSTNGSAPQPISARPDSTGISALWAEAVAGYSPQLGSVISAGVWLDRHLFLTVRHSSGDPQEGARYHFLHHQPTGAWTTLSDGVTADMYATAFAPGGELYAACGDDADPVRLLALSGLFTPGAGNTADANGEDVEPTVTLRPFAASPSLKAYGFGHLTANVVGGTPTLVVATAPGLTAPAFTTRLSVTDTGVLRRRFDGCTDSEALTVRITQSGASQQTELLAVEMEARPYDPDSEIA